MMGGSESRDTPLRNVSHKHFQKLRTFLKDSTVLFMLKSRNVYKYYNKYCTLSRTRSEICLWKWALWNSEQRILKLKKTVTQDVAGVVHNTQRQKLVNARAVFFVFFLCTFCVLVCSFSQPEVVWVFLTFASPNEIVVKHT